MKIRSILVLVTLLGAISTAAAQPMGGGRMRGGPGHPPPIHEAIRAHADELGIDDATVREITEIAEAARPQLMQLRDQLDEARARMDALMEADTLDRKAILAQSLEVSEAHDALKAAELNSMLDMREKLTAGQWRQLRDMRPRHDGPPPEMRRGGGRGDRERER